MWRSVRRYSLTQKEGASVVNLAAKTPFDGTLPLDIGATRLEEIDAGSLTSLTPFGDPAPLAEALKTTHNLDWPAPNRATPRGRRSVRPPSRSATDRMAAPGSRAPGPNPR